MKPAWLAKVPPAWRARMVRMGFNLHPAFRGTGGRVEHVAPDLSHIRIRLPLSWRTRNVVGSIYGGSLFAVTDGLHPMMLMAALGEDVIVWDKAASIRYRKPGYSTLYADFSLDADEVALAIESARLPGKKWNIGFFSMGSIANPDIIPAVARYRSPSRF